MNIKKSTLSVAVAGLMSVGLVGQAAAYTSAGSKIEFQNLSIGVFDSAGNEIFGNVNNFAFSTSNTTNLTSTIADADNCAGTTLPFVNTCPGAGGIADPRLDSDIQLQGDSTHAENNFNLDGPGGGGGGSYSYSDSAIITAQLTGDPTTTAALIAETELNATGNGQSNSTIQSSTGYTFDFSVDDSGEIRISFQADPEAYSESANPGSILAIAQSNIAFSVTLTQQSGGADEATWTPDGVLDVAGGCDDVVGLTCAESADDENLTENTGVNVDPASDHYSELAVFSDYGITISGLSAGDWSFVLTANVANQVNKVSVPEPGTLLLLGAGLAGFAATRRRTKKA